MVKGYCIGNTGDGKTLWMTLDIVEWAKKHPKGQIHGNYHVKLPNFNFSPCMFLPFDKLEQCYIAFDDVSSLDVIKRYIKVTANKSRKAFMKISFTAQYPKMIPKQLRAMADFKVKTKLDEYNDILTVYTLVRGKGWEKTIYYDVIETIKKYDLYDTYEIVEDPVESDIIEEIIRLSKTKKDVEKNLYIYTGNKQERKTLLKEILKEMDLQDEIFDPEEKEQTNDQILNEILYYHGIKGYSFNKTSEMLGTTEGTIKYHWYKFKGYMEKQKAKI